MAETKLKTRTIKLPSGETMEVTHGSGNIFADLGFPDADEMLLKAELSAEIIKLMQKKKLNQTQLGRLIGLDQARVSKLMNGKMHEFSVERLLEILNRLGRRVELRISKQEYAPAQAKTVVKIA